MPHVNGYDLALRLRANFAQEQLKLVAITAYNSQVDRLRSEEAGFDAHIPKPIEPGVLERIGTREA